MRDFGSAPPSLEGERSEMKTITLAQAIALLSNPNCRAVVFDEHCITFPAICSTEDPPQPKDIFLDLAEIGYNSHVHHFAVEDNENVEIDDGDMILVNTAGQQTRLTLLNRSPIILP